MIWSDDGRAKFGKPLTGNLSEILSHDALALNPYYLGGWRFGLVVTRWPRST